MVPTNGLRLVCAHSSCWSLNSNISNAYYLEIGLLLRNPAVHNPLMDSHWTVSLLFSLVQELTLLYDAGNDNFDGVCPLFVNERDVDKSFQLERQRGA